ncbi:MAG: GNAT family N-acetyltransferase [Aeromicrobium erythreum]
MRPGPQHVGHRLSVRHVTPDGSATDVVGRLLAADDDALRLQRRDGSERTVPQGTVIAWRVVPDRPRRPRAAAAIDPEDLIRVTSRGWPALESRPLGDWELRASAGFTGRANSVAVHGDPGLPVEAATDAVRAFYATRDLPPLAQVVVGSAWDTRLRATGWTVTRSQRPGAVVQVADLAAPAEHDPPDPQARVTTEPDDDWWRLYHRTGDTDRGVARRVLTGPSVVGFVHLGDPVVAVGRVVVTGEWAGLAAVEVDPAHRRRGLGRRVVTTSLAWAAARGADKAYLQTMQDNAAALALYAPFGFRDHHAYAYLEAPA